MLTRVLCAVFSFAADSSGQRKEKCSERWGDIRTPHITAEGCTDSVD